MTQNKKIIGLTGGIASGKSQASNYLREKGYHVIDADIVAREIVHQGNPGHRAIIEHFGPHVLDENGEINRAYLGEIVFNDSNKRQLLNQILHPLISEEILKEVAKANESLIFLDIPLLFETREAMASSGLSFDEIWLVYVEHKLQIKRLMSRDQITKNYAMEKIKSQMPLEDKRNLAHLILDNNKDHHHLYAQIDRALMEINHEI